jgi:hypothetical protein
MPSRRAGAAESATEGKDETPITAHAAARIVARAGSAG